MGSGAVEIPYGPFPIRWKRLGLALLFAMVAAIVAFATQRSTRLECTRDGAAECVLTRTGPGGRAHAFPISAVRTVDFHEYRTKGGKKGSVELVDTRGHATRLGERSLEEARADYRAIEAFFGDGGPPTLHIEIRPSPWIWVLVVLFGIACLGLLASVASDLVRPRLRLESEAVVATRTLLGVPLGTVRHPLSAGTTAEVEARTRSDFWAHRYAPDEVIARLVLTSPDGGRVPLFETFFRGGSIHEEAARALNAALGGPVSESPRADSPPSAEPVSPTNGRSASRTVKFAVIAVVVAIVGSFAIDHFATRGQGTLELECVHRCRMGAMTCLPGGSMRIPLDPGVHSIEVWNPDVETQWVSKTVEIEADETSVFQCRP